jgi:hypothetical protein
VHVRCPHATPVAKGAERKKRTYTFVPGSSAAQRADDQNSTATGKVTRLERDEIEQGAEGGDEH